MRLLDQVERLHGSLDYHLSRHNVLTANLAHVDTPGYRPLDLKRTAPATAFGAELETAMVATNPMHLGGTRPQAGEVITDDNATPGLDGNAVSVDREAVKIAANHVRYDVLATLTQNELTSLAWAANDGRTV